MTDLTATLAVLRDRLTAADTYLSQTAREIAALTALVDQLDGRLPVNVGQQCLTIPKVAAELGLGTRTVYAMIERGELSVVIVAGKQRVQRSDLQRFIDARLTTNTPSASRPRLRRV